MSFACRCCGAALTHVFVDLGSTPLANDYPDNASVDLPTYPLKVWVCGSCFLVQLHHDVTPQAIFGDYAYFSSYSTSWLDHARRFSEQMIGDLHLGKDSLVIEAASNDGYLLRNFSEHGIPSLGIEPAANVAAAARGIGVPTEVMFLGRDTAARLKAEGKQADLVVANNVIAHVPDLNDFIAGLAILLKPTGLLSIECPHLLRLIETSAFDTIYHEHFSYLSLLALRAALARHGLKVIAVQELPTHGGSLRILATHGDYQPDDTLTGAYDMTKVDADERAAGLDSIDGYRGFATKVDAIRQQLRAFVDVAKQGGKRIAAYGAAAKGNTLLNVCGLTAADIDFVVDRNPAKQNRVLPGSKIPVFDPEKIRTEKPDYVLILPWNLADEIRQQLAFIHDWGGQFVAAIPIVGISG